MNHPLGAGGAAVAYLYREGVAPDLGRDTGDATVGIAADSGEHARRVLDERRGSGGAEPEMRRQVDMIDEERHQTIVANEALPGPAPGGLDRLRQSIEAETTALDKARAGLGGWLAELGRLFTSPTPSAVRWAGAAALALFHFAIPFLILLSRYNKLDSSRLVKMAYWILALSGIVLFASLFYFRFWCRYLCPAGAFLALFNKLRLLRRWGLTSMNSLTRRRNPAWVMVV